MNKAISRNLIDKSALRENDYLASLLEAGHDASLISGNTVKRVRTDCLMLLASRAMLFTKGKSSSVPVETAQLLMDSVIHTIGFHLKSFPTPEDAASFLESGKNAVFRSFCLGLKEIENSYKMTKKRYTRLRKHLLKTPNEFYTSTLSSGLAAFFKNYSPDYASHIRVITADYRPMKPIPELDGLEFISPYVDYLYIENSFLDNLGDDAVHRAMYSYDASYAAELVNLFETVLFASLVPVSRGKGLNGLKPNKSDRAWLCSKLESLDETGTEDYIRSLTDGICDECDCDDMIRDYISDCVPVMTAKIRAYVSRGITAQLFVMNPPETESTEYIDGEQMPDAKYDELVSEVMQCDGSEKKVELIFASVRSVADLADVIRDADVGDDVIKMIKARLSSEENELLESYM